MGRMLARFQALDVPLNWYLIYTKPRQEMSALKNLEQQGYQCYLPTIPIEKLRNGMLAVTDEPLFPRYLFIRLGLDCSAKSWGPIRSTIGVSRLVIFGVEPAKIDDRMIEQLRTQEALVKNCPERVFTHGERVHLTEYPFAGIEGVYQMADADHRVMVLIEILSKPVTVRVSLAGLHKAS